MAPSHPGLGLNTSLDIDKSVKTDSKLYVDRKLAGKRDPVYSLRANQLKDSLPTLYNIQVLTHSWLPELSSSVACQNPRLLKKLMLKAGTAEWFI